MDVETAAALVSPRGQELLSSLPPYQEADVVRLTSAARKRGYDPALVAAALTQSRLRAKAIDKFGQASTQLLFTPDALEQATRTVLGQRHAARFMDADVRHVIDAGCGIGADSRFFAEAGLTVDAVELDEATATLATFNLTSFPNARVHCANAHTFDASTDAAWWFDPARRLTGTTDIHGKTKRTFSLGALTPSWEFVHEKCGSGPAGGAKLSPSFPHLEIPHGCEAEFTSYNGEVLECALWWGGAVRHAGRSATIVRQSKDGGVSFETVTEADAAATDELSIIEEVGAYLYEADKALTRSGLVGALTARTGGAETHHGYGYVSADELVDVGLLAKRYRVLDALPLHTKTLRSYLRERQIGNLTIKKRGVDVDDATLRKELKLKGKASMTIALTRIGGNTVVLVVEQIH